MQVHEIEKMLNTWMQHADELRSQYDWLLFFNVPKLLLLHSLLRAKKPDLEAIVHEISFLFSNEQASWESMRKLVKVSSGKSEGEGLG